MARPKFPSGFTAQQLNARFGKEPILAQTPGGEVVRVCQVRIMIDGKMLGWRMLAGRWSTDSEPIVNAFPASKAPPRKTHARVGVAPDTQARVSRLKKPELQHCLTASTAHITPEDAERLNQLVINPGPDSPALIVYAKDEYGWWVLCDQRSEALASMSDAFRGLVAEALSHGCTWLILDRDGPVYPELPYIEW